MATPRIEGANWGIQIETTTDTWVTIGCSNTFSFKASNSPINVNCDSNGTKALNFYGQDSYSAEIGGTVFDYETGEEAANYTPDEFLAAQKAKTKLKIRGIQLPVTAGTSKVKTLSGCIVSDISEDYSNGQVGTYRISLAADDAVNSTLPA